MNGQQIKEGNKLIAEFMDWKFKKETEHPHCFPNGVWIKPDKIGVDRLQFNCDWNELMQVVEKIESIDQYEDGGFQVSISALLCDIETMTGGHLCRGFEDSKIKSVYTAVVAFINWYNSQTLST